MSIKPGFELSEPPEGRSDPMLEMIYHMIEELNQTHLDVLAAGAMSDPSAFDAYNKMSQLDSHIDTLLRMRMSDKHRLNVHYTRQ